MRSTGFVVVSIMIHVVAVLAIALTPTRTVSPDAGETIEVQMGNPADKPGVAEAKSEEASKPQAIASEPTPTPKPEVKATPAPAPKPKPIAEKKAKPVKAAAVVPTPEPEEEIPAADVAKETPKEETPSDDVDTKAIPAEALAEQQQPTKEEPIAKPEPVAAAAVVEKKEEKKEEKKPQTQPAPVAAAAVVPAQEAKPAAAPTPKVDGGAGAGAPVAATSDKEQETGELNKGGETKEGAVSFLDLRQLPGNKNPNYPRQARLENRQGQLELVYRVTNEGKVADIQVAKSSGFKDLDAEAVRAISQFKFVPGQEGWARHPVTFSLKGNVATLPSHLRSKGGVQAQADDE